MQNNHKWKSPWAGLCEAERSWRLGAGRGQHQPLGDGCCPGGCRPREERDGGGEANKPKQTDDIRRNRIRVDRWRHSVCASSRENGQGKTAASSRTDGGHLWLWNNNQGQVRGPKQKTCQCLFGKANYYIYTSGNMFLFYRFQWYDV